MKTPNALHSCEPKWSRLQKHQTPDSVPMHSEDCTGSTKKPSNMRSVANTVGDCNFPLASVNFTYGKTTHCGARFTFNWIEIRSIVK